MKHIKFFVLSVALLFISCKKKKDVVSNPIIGNWNFEKVIAKDTSVRPSIPYYPDNNYIFYKNNVCDVKSGFVMHIRESKKAFAASVYLGTKTNYTLKGNIVSIYDRTNFRWERFKIISVDEKHLVLKDNDSVTFRLEKHVDKIRDTTHYDAIIVSKTPCFGKCPINYTMIDKGGKLYYKGVDFNTVNGYRTGICGKDKFIAFENKFRQLDIPKLQEHYSPEFGITDCAMVYITFIKDGKIFKTISDYYDSAPIELVSGMEELSFYYQKVYLDFYESESRFDENIELSSFKNDTEWYVLDSPETFYLQVLLNNSKVSESEFTPKYQLSYFNWGNKKSNIRKIETDGRYYRFIMASGLRTTYDLGYNFIDRNKLQLKPHE